MKDYKNNNKNLGVWLTIVGTIVGLLLIFANTVRSFNTVENRQTTIQENIKILDEKGCEKSRENEKSIIGMKKDIGYIKEKVDKIADKVNAE